MKIIKGLDDLVKINLTDIISSTALCMQIVFDTFLIQTEFVNQGELGGAVIYIVQSKEDYEIFKEHERYLWNSLPENETFYDNYIYRLLIAGNGAYNVVVTGHKEHLSDE